jgi:hypothetical protein
MPPADAFAFAIGGAADDEEVRGLLRNTPLPGSISLSFEREPDGGIAAAMEGSPHQTIVARERASGRLAAVASRSVRLRFLNGRPARVGYLGQLRVDPAFRRAASLLDAGFSFCRRLHDEDPCDTYFASVIAENAGARRLLERGRGGWPAFSPVDDIVTLAVPVRALRWTPRSTSIVSGADVGAARIADFLSRYNAGHQLAPCWNADDLDGDRLPGLSLRDFLVVTRAGAIVGCAAVWDQRAFKQVVVRAYAPSLRRARPLLNSVAPLIGAPPLPAVGEQVRYACLSHFAVENGEIGVAQRLIAETLHRARSAGLDFVTIGLSHRSPIQAHIRRGFRHRSYKTVLYAATWPGGTVPLDDRPAQPEIAIL